MTAMSIAEYNAVLPPLPVAGCCEAGVAFGAEEALVDPEAGAVGCWDAAVGGGDGGFDGAAAGAGCCGAPAAAEALDDAVGIAAAVEA